MSRSLVSTRQRLITTAKELFGRQGITQTTTRQIADAAGVNEVTLFRHFGTKQGLLLAVFADLGIFDGVGDLELHSTGSDYLKQDLILYVSTCFKALANNPELVRSVVGEAGLYSGEHRQALQQGFSQAQERLATSLQQIASPDTDPDQLRIASGVLHLLILGAGVLQVTAGLPEPLPTDRSQSSESGPEDPDHETQDHPTLLQKQLMSQWLEYCVEVWLNGSDLLNSPQLNEKKK